MRFHVNFQSGKAVYLQLVDQVRTAAAAGAVRAGEALPTIRGLAEQLRVNRNTVAKAYAELESQGIIETAVGRGSFVRAPTSPLQKSARIERLVGELDGVVVHAHHLLIPKAEFLTLAQQRYDLLEERRATTAPHHD
jgi:GntR family transcriptional regulator